MSIRNAAIALAACCLMAAPAAAVASPAPDPPSHRTADTVSLAMNQLTAAYVKAASSEKRSLHNEIVLLRNIGDGAL